MCIPIKFPFTVRIVRRGRLKAIADLERYCVELRPSGYWPDRRLGQIASRTACEAEVHQPCDPAAAEAGAGHISKGVFHSLQYGVGGPPTAADRRPDPFAQIAGGESGGIAGQQRVVDTS